MQIANVLTVAAIGLLMAAAGFAKDGPTFYTPERVKTARNNVTHYIWAKNRLALLRSGDNDGKSHYYIGPQFGPADKLTEKSDDFVWMLMPTTKIARHVPVQYKAQCPIHGAELKRLDPYCGYNIDPLNHPYKVQCKVGGEWWPTNDYAAGDMTGGDYPDDGEGAHRNGTIYYFLRDYTHMVYASVVIPSLRSLSQAWLITGDRRYARKGCILLAKVAMEYPNEHDRRDRLFYARQPNFEDPDYPGKIGGRVTDWIWETFCLEALAYAYDGLYGYMDDPELIAYLQSKGMPIKTGDDLRRYIENYILRSGIEGLLSGQIQGNPGHHQAAAAAVALVLDDYNESKDNPFNSAAAVDYIRRYRHGNLIHDSDIMVNGLERDGGGEENPGYSVIKLDFMRVADVLELIRARRPERFPVDKYPPIFEGPKAKRLFDFFIDLTIHGWCMPSIGDSNGITAPQRIEPYRWSSIPAADYVWAFGKYGDPRFATASLDLKTGKPAEGDLFEPYPLAKIMAAAATPEAKINWTSRILDGYGIAILDSGTGDNRRAVALNYTHFKGHAQCDPLMIEIFARGVNVLPDLGYPASWQYFYQWDANSLAHNTVTIDQTQPTLQPNGGMLRLFASRDNVHVAAASENPYSRDRASMGSDKSPPNNLYQRMVVMVDVDARRFYIVDLFTANGGVQHDQSWHGMLVPAEDPSLNWSVQTSGTWAGKDVPLFANWTDQWGRQRDDFPSYLTDIRTAPLTSPAAWTWNSGLDRGDALRLHVIPVDDNLTAVRGNGQAPNRPDNWKLPFLMVHRDISNGDSTRFLSVLDAFQGKPTVQSVRLISRSPMVLEVDLGNRKDTIHLNVPRKNGISPAPQSIGVRVVSIRDGKTAGDVRIGQWSPQVPTDQAFSAGRITAVDYAQNRIAVTLNPKVAPVGAPIRIYNESRSAMYQVAAADTADGRLWLTLDATALLARGKVSQVKEGVLYLDTNLSLADGTDTYNQFAGAWLGDEKTGLVVKGADRMKLASQVFLAQPPPDAQLEKRFLGKTVQIWQYHPGDLVEIARVESEKP